MTQGSNNGSTSSAPAPDSPSLSLPSSNPLSFSTADNTSGSVQQKQLLEQKQCHNSALPITSNAQPTHGNTKHFQKESSSSLSISSAEEVIAIRIITIDHYMAPPHPLMDRLVTPFSMPGTRLKHVPVIRVFGSTPSGQKACVHVHQASS
jgi:hypothetical protein